MGNWEKLSSSQQPSNKLIISKKQFKTNWDPNSKLSKYAPTVAVDTSSQSADRQVTGRTGSRGRPGGARRVNTFLWPGDWSAESMMSTGQALNVHACAIAGKQDFRRRTYFSSTIVKDFSSRSNSKRFFDQANVHDSVSCSFDQTLLRQPRNLSRQIPHEQGNRPWASRNWTLPVHNMHTASLARRRWINYLHLISKWQLKLAFSTDLWFRICEFVNVRICATLNNHSGPAAISIKK